MGVRSELMPPWLPWAPDVWRAWCVSLGAEKRAQGGVSMAVVGEMVGSAPRWLTPESKRIRPIVESSKWQSKWCTHQVPLYHLKFSPFLWWELMIYIFIYDHPVDLGSTKPNEGLDAFGWLQIYSGWCVAGANDSSYDGSDRTVWACRPICGSRQVKWQSHDCYYYCSFYMFFTCFHRSNLWQCSWKKGDNWYEIRPSMDQRRLVMSLPIEKGLSLGKWFSLIFH